MAKTARNAKRKSAQAVAAEVSAPTTKKTVLHIVAAGSGTNETISLPETKYRWAPTSLKVNLTFTPDAAEKQEHPPQLPYPSKADLALEAAELIYQKKIKPKGKVVKGKPVNVDVDIAMLDMLHASWEKRPVSKKEMRTALEESRRVIGMVAENDRYQQLDLGPARAQLQQTQQIFEANYGRRDAGRLDWVELKEMAEEATRLAYEAETERNIKKIRQRAAVGTAADQATIEAHISFRLGYTEGGKRNYELRELDRDLKAAGWNLPGDR